MPGAKWDEEEKCEDIYPISSQEFHLSHAKKPDNTSNHLSEAAISAEQLLG